MKAIPNTQAIEEHSMFYFKYRECSQCYKMSASSQEIKIPIALFQLVIFIST